METNTKTEIEAEYRNFIIKKKHPCVMANTIFSMDKYHLKIYENMGSDAIIENVLKDVEKYLDQYDFESNDFESLMFCFKDDQFTSEKKFEVAIWEFLQKLHNHDDAEWDATVSSCPEDSNFSFSVKGRAFYIVGMFPKSSRLARQAPYCTIVFNLHWQFEKLREMDTYQAIKTRIRRRDKKLQGYINPVLKDFGKDSETKQYSGRYVEATWQCPFHKKN